MAPFPTIIKQITTEVHSEINRIGCQRLGLDKHKLQQKQEGPIGGKHIEDELKIPREGMERKLNRLKIYRRALGSLAIYFKSYAPILVNIKKSYDDMLTFRLRQFKEAQKEKVRLHHENASLQAQMSNYKFPEDKKLQKTRRYLTLLMTRIHKQDESIKFITEILSK